MAHLDRHLLNRHLQCFANIYLNWFRDISSSLTSLHLFEKEIKTSPEFPSTSILPLSLSLENLLESGSDFWIFSGLPAAVISAPWNCTWPQHQEAPRGGCSSGWRFRSTPPHTHTHAGAFACWGLGAGIRAVLAARCSPSSFCLCFRWEITRENEEITVLMIAAPQKSRVYGGETEHGEGMPWEPDWEVLICFYLIQLLKSKTKAGGIRGLNSNGKYNKD